MFRNVRTVILGSEPDLDRSVRGRLENTRFTVMASCQSLAGVNVRNDAELFLICLAGDLPCETLTLLQRRYQAARFVILSTSLHPDQITQASRLGISAFLPSDCAPEALIAYLNLVISNYNVYPSALVPDCRASLEPAQRDEGPQQYAGSALIRPTISDSRQQGGNDPLTRRQTAILKLLIDGEPNKAIGRILNIAEGTVKIHVKNALKKIGVQNRTQAAIWAVSNGFPAIADVPETRFAPQLAPVLTGAPYLGWRQDARSRPESIRAVAG